MSRNFRILVKGWMEQVPLSTPSVITGNQPVALILARFGQAGERVTLQPAPEDTEDTALPLALDGLPTLYGRLSAPVRSNHAAFLLQSVLPDKVRIPGTFCGSAGVLLLSLEDRLSAFGWLQLHSAGSDRREPSDHHVPPFSDSGAGVYLRVRQADWSAETIID